MTTPKTTYVLLHGGAAGAWIWKHTAEVLRSRGHRVHCVTFTGFGERRHLISADSTIEQHVTDVVNELQFGDFSDVVLVAHSYSGTVVPGVVARAGDRLRRIIYLDSVILHTGETIAEAMGFMPPGQSAAVAAGIRAGAIPVDAPVAEQQRAEARERPFRMSAERQQWMLDHLSSMPAIAGVSLVAVGAETIKRPVDYIAVSDTVMKAVMHDRARKLGWRVHEVDGDHAILVGEPERTADLIEKLS